MSINAFRLPSKLTVGGAEYAIDTDYRTIIYILARFADPEYEPDEAALICIQLLYKDWESIPQEFYGEALERARDFIDCGMEPSKSDINSRRHSRMMDWEQDAPRIAAAINGKLGYDIRTVEYMHWWTFLGYYMDIDEKCLYSTVLYIREKLSSGKKLEKHEREFYNKNRKIIDLQPKRSESEQAEYDEWKAAVKKLLV